MDHLKYLLCFFFPGCVVWFLYTGPHTIIDALAWIIPLWLLIVMDGLSPKIDINKQKNVISDGYYEAILYALSFIQLLIISLLVIYASQLQWGTVAEIVVSFINLVIMRILVGTTSGSSAIIVAHELIHRPKYWQRFLGRLLLYSVCYEHFIIAHMKSHHLRVATVEDITTARLDENFSSYWNRVVVAHFKYAWDSEVRRLGLLNASVYQYKMLANSVLQGVMIECLIVLMICLVFGWAAAIIFLYQALSGVRLLETINYYQHWGLEQGKSNNALAWVNQSLVTEYALVGLSNHIEHHQNSVISFHQIPYSEKGPKMPYGYFVTNLWVKLGNQSYRRVSMEILQKSGLLKSKK